MKLQFSIANLSLSGETCMESIKIMAEYNFNDQTHLQLSCRDKRCRGHIYHGQVNIL